MSAIWEATVSMLANVLFGSWPFRLDRAVACAMVS